jgi:peptidoglycan-associated lipoprotein
MVRLKLVLALTLGALAAGCADNKPPPQVASAPVGPRSDAIPAAFAGASRGDTNSPTSGSVHIDARILQACGDLPTAHFAYDSAAVQPATAAALGALARCFVSGPLQGKRMRLVGHADSRGEVEYNLELGQRRAGSVAELLARFGLARSRVETTSHGEFDATGTDEVGWARDRKVDVSLAD